jgi:hypothetical protein
MKTRLSFLYIFIISALVVLLYKVGYVQEYKTEFLKGNFTNNNTWLKKFYIGGIDCEIDYKTGYRNLDILGFSLWHNYLSTANVNGKEYPYVLWYDNSIGNDSLFTPVDNYAVMLKEKVRNIYSHNGRRLLMSRPKIDYLCFGQRSDYQCEPISKEDDLWFYSFNYHHPTAPVEMDSGCKVIHCRSLTSNNLDYDEPGYVVLGLRANTEQCKDEEGWRGDSQSKWIIKPRIRIDSSVANNPNNYNKPICRIEIVNASGKLIKTFILKVKNFLDSITSHYNGNYKEVFDFKNDTGNTQQLFSSWNDTLKWGWIFAARGDSSSWFPNRADIRLYWYGECDMWIDYIRVDNEVADNLFSGVYDTLWIYKEVAAILDSTYPAVMKYYLEYVEFNNLPCVSYVNKKLKEYSHNTIDIIQDFSYTIAFHVPWKERRKIMNAKFLYKHYIQKAGFSQIFAESYPLTACYTLNKERQNFSKVPNTLPVLNKKQIDSVLAMYVSVDEYEDYLQDNINNPNYILEGDNYINTFCNDYISYYQLRQDQGNFRFIMQLCDSISKLADIPFIFMPQVHQNFVPGEVRREPTNQELNMITNVALTYGAKGLLYFSYITWHKPGENIYVKGITEDDDTTLRTLNFYHQIYPNKKETLQNIVRHIDNSWGNILLKFDNKSRKSYIYDFEYERKDLFLNSYFTKFITFKPGKKESNCLNDSFNNILPELVADCQNKTYLQIATFEDGQKDTHYFMVVNRRCSPTNSLDTIGGKRRIVAFINLQILLKNNLQCIIFDCETNYVVAKLEYSNYPILVDLGWFNPGEGKLFKVIVI